MNKKQLLQRLKSFEKGYELISKSLETFDYAKGLMDGAKIAISSVIKEIEKED